MRITVTACMLVLTVCVLLAMSANPIGADNKGWVGTYGYIYPCKTEDYNKAVKAKKNQGEYIDATHFVYEPTGNKTVDMLQRQKWINSCMDEGWEIKGFDGEAILIYNPRISTWQGESRAR